MDEARFGKPGDQLAVDFRVRYAECDAMGYLHHARYWEYFEQARTELLRKKGFRYRDLESEGCFFVVYKAAIRYLIPIRYDDLVNVTVTVARITRTRVDHTYVVSRGAERTTEASTTLACVGPDGRPRLMPEELWSSPPENTQESAILRGRKAVRNVNTNR
ncbi:MAG: thioesterase family protein [Phycisphaerales bacterium]|nr:thioesterase family protein [Phycisphaerales bacterium]